MHKVRETDFLVGAISIASILIERRHVDVHQCIGTAVSFGGSAKIGLSNLAAGTVTVRVSIFVCNRSLPIPWAEELDRRAIIIYAQSHRPRIGAPRDSFISIIRVDVRLVSSPGLQQEKCSPFWRKDISKIYISRVVNTRTIPPRFADVYDALCAAAAA